MAMIREFRFLRYDELAVQNDLKFHNTCISRDIDIDRDCLNILV